ncbi:hypothetical protein [Bifidobacterium biavatii]|uniref:Uncharacterized protein n=1 Tax=Bifidobacterium biavatii DSM 23969 TaxID=1437608 RepID=A0A086ZHW0_9BIFI|nr:hypothetical protein [Bifidobacterium biavatii]KFI46110.1 hypothetical protein BBIA_2075 [Bifidobacterium biavatii DSM 23969]
MSEGLTAMLAGVLVKDPQTPTAGTVGRGRLLVRTISPMGETGETVTVIVTAKRELDYLRYMQPRQGDRVIAAGIIPDEATDEPTIEANMLAFGSSLDMNGDAS